MATPFIPLPAEAFPEAARPSIERLNVFLLELSRLEGTLRQPISSRRSDQSVARREVVRVDASRVVGISSGGGGAPTDASYVLISADADLTDERILDVSSPLTKSDGGAGGNVTLGVSTTALVTAIGGTPALGLSTGNAAGSAATFVRTDATIATFGTQAPAALATSAAVGTSAYAARADHAHEFGPTLQSTANDSTLTLTDDATDQLLTNSLGSLRLDTPGLILNPPTAAAASRVNINLDADFNDYGIQSAWATGSISGRSIGCWDARYSQMAGIFSSARISGFASSLFSVAPSATSGSTNSMYGIDLGNSFQIRNTNATWTEVATAYFKGVHRLISSPLITTQATVIIEPPTAGVSAVDLSASPQIGLLIRQQAAQATAATRAAIWVDAQNSGTSRYSFYGVSDTLYQGGVALIGGPLRHTGTQIGLHGSSSIAQSTGWSASGFTASKTLNGASFSLNEVMSVLNTLITHFVNRGDLAA